MKKVFFGILLITNAAGIAYAENDPLHIHFLSVGYGDAIFITTPTKEHFFIDIGGTSTEVSLIDFLDREKIDHLRGVIITHAHENHFGGLAALLSHVSISTIYTTELAARDETLGAFFSEAREKNIPTQWLKREDRITAGPEVVIRALHPDPDQLTGDPNADSLVLEIRFGGMRVLLPADITPEVQQDLIAKKLLIAPPHLVALPHHGDFMAPAFEALIRPAKKIISTGPYDRWPSPRPEIVQRYGNELYRTDLQGNLHFIVEKDHIRYMPAPEQSTLRKS